MKEFPPLASFGDRICVCGPSNAGKSTLAQALGKKLDVPVSYLDLLRHQPFTKWVPRPQEEFERLHVDAIAEPRWVIEGNYASLLPLRFSRATGIILLGSEPWRQLGRYVRRTLFEKNRAGQIAGGQDRLNWTMVHLILFVQPPKRHAFAHKLGTSGLPLLELNSMRELNALYASWELKRRGNRVTDATPSAP